MLLRSITKHIKDQNWFAVVLDFLIVVVGVFIGLQVANWNEARTERVLERSYNFRLQDDLNRSRERTISSTNWMIGQSENQAVVLKSLAACSALAEEQNVFALGLYDLGKLDTATLNRTVIDEMISTGRSDLFQDMELRSKLSSLIQEVDYQKRTAPNINQRVTPVVNDLRRRVILDSVTINEGNKVDITWERLQFDMADLCNDPSFRAGVESVRDNTFVMIRWNLRIIDMIDELSAALQSEAKERDWNDVL
jgi:hypothetical protein